MLIATLQPNLNQPEFEKFQRMGELAYEANCRRLAFDWIRKHPGRFAIISMKRFFYYWNGVPSPTDSLHRGIFAARCSWPRLCWRSGDWFEHYGKSGPGHGFSQDLF